MKKKIACFIIYILLVLSLFPGCADTAGGESGQESSDAGISSAIPNDTSDTVTSASSDPGQEKLFEHKNYGGTIPKIFIIGNSFIASSEIEENLRMINETEEAQIEIDSIAIGYGTVDQYFEYMDDYIPMARSGYYDVIFLCGFYSSSSASIAARKFIAALDATDTQVVLFPAENEDGQSAYKSFEENNCGLANWKSLITVLYSEGFSKYDLCIEDIHNHTNGLGGFAGACLVYSYLFDKIPENPALFEEIVLKYSDFLPPSDKSGKIALLHIIAEKAHYISNSNG